MPILVLHKNGRFFYSEKKVVKKGRLPRKRASNFGLEGLPTEFFQEQKNINNINCYSNEGGTWKKTDLKFQNQVLIMGFKEKFVPRRGRVNCSLNDNGQWRWFGTQFTVKKN